MCSNIVGKSIKESLRTNESTYGQEAIKKQFI